MPVSSTYPASTPGTYTVQSGDTLSTIAQTIWGDASLWYVLADANALTTASPTSDISASPFNMLGTSLMIPNVVGNIHNSASTFKPYDPSTHLGNTSPTLPDAPPPDTGGGCGGAAMILEIIVVVVVAYFTGGAALEAMNYGADGAIASGVGLVA